MRGPPLGPLTPAQAARRRLDAEFTDAIADSPILLSFSDYALAMVRNAVLEAFDAGWTGAERAPEATYIPWQRLRPHRHNTIRAWVRRGHRAGRAFQAGSRV